MEAEGGLLYGEKVVLLGDNGSGKTTLFKLLLGEMEPDSWASGARNTIGNRLFGAAGAGK